MNRRFRAHASLSCALLVILSVIAVQGSARPFAPAAQKRFNPEGDLNPIGKAPEGLTEVSHISLYRSAPGRPFTSHARSGLNTTRGELFRFRAINASQNNFTFTTVARRGTSYSFTGRFLRGGVFAELDYTVWNQPIAEGTLTKFKDGKKVSAARMRFSYFGGT